MIEYITGRKFNGIPQVLVITVISAPDESLETLEAVFRDNVRGIKGTVDIPAKDYPLNIGAAVVREYEAGRYFLHPAT